MNGLVYAYMLDGKGRGTIVDWQDINDHRPETGTLWIHLNYSDDTVKKWIQTESSLSALSCEILMEQDTRPRHVKTTDGFLLILRGVNFNPESDLEDMVALRMSFEENRIITMCQRPVMALKDIHEALEAGRGPKNTLGFLAMSIDRIVDRMGEMIAEVDEQVDKLEDAVLTADIDTFRSQLAQIRRQNITLRRHIAPQRDVLARLQNEHPEWANDKTRLQLREFSERTVRFIEELDSVRDRTSVTQEELNNRLSEQINKAMYVLSIVTVIFLPLGLITGLLGINVGGIPGAEYKWAFLIVVLILIVIVSLLINYFRRIKWL
ncbi:MAG: zinc transporter ZntB [Desulfuromusa sp.]|nr:zinc transporter ZntB [Desulfuromusa sp.]